MKANEMKHLRAALRNPDIDYYDKIFNVPAKQHRQQDEALRKEPAVRFAKQHANKQRQTIIRKQNSNYSKASEPVEGADKDI